MQQPDVRIDALHHLAVELQHQAQHAVRGRMLRAEVDVEVADFGFWHCDASVDMSRPVRRRIGPKISSVIATNCVVVANS